MTVRAYVLLIDADPEHAAWIQSLFQPPSAAPAAELWHTPSVESAVHLLAREPACVAVLLDCRLPQNPALELLAALRAQVVDVPVVVLCAEDWEQAGLSAVLAGAQDYLVSGQLDAGLLGRALHYAMQRIAVEAAIVERSLRDTLTGLPRRQLLLDRLAVAMRRCARDGSSGTLLLVDLELLESTGALPGYVERNAVLQAVGQRLDALVRDSDTVARFEGSRFAVLLPNESRVLEALAVGEKLAEAVAKPLALHGRELQTSAAIGISRFRDATESAQAMLERAELAMLLPASDPKSRVRLL